MYGVHIHVHVHEPSVYTCVFDVCLNVTRVMQHTSKVYMNTVFSDFVRCVILTLRGASTYMCVQMCCMVCVQHVLMRCYRMI